MLRVPLRPFRFREYLRHVVCFRKLVFYSVLRVPYMMLNGINFRDTTTVSTPTWCLL